MAWKIELATAAEKDLEKIDPPVARRILDFLYRRVSGLDDPRSLGDPLRGSKLGEFWKYRVGDYRIICKIEDDAIKILVVRIRHRSIVYR